MQKSDFLSRIRSNIASSGYHVTVVTGGALPRYARTNLLCRCLLAGLLLGPLGCAFFAGPHVRREGRTTRNGRQYVLLYPEGLSVRLVTRRPDPADERVHLSVAAAYTDLGTDRPLDLLVSGGRLRQTAATVGFLDGALTLVGDSVRIARVAPGQAPPRAQLEGVRRRRGSVLLQELLVWAGRNQRGPGGGAFQRRALVTLADHRLAVVESEEDALTLHAFAEDLRELGAANALYLDMGGWDEGWYRTGRSVVRLGHRRTDTDRQSNWLVFATPVAPAPSN